MFLARHHATGQLMTLKVAKAGEVAAGALRREAKILSGLRHPGLPVLVAADGAASPPWLATAWRDGWQTLRSRLCGVWSPGALGAHRDEARRVMAEVCAALAYLHAQGIAHRDVTPENVLLAPGGGALLADLGMARAFDAGGKEPLEVAGVVEGAPGYMAPEQICGDRVDGRADLYALGCVLHEVVCGRPPFEGAPVEVLRQHLHERPRPLGGGVPPELEAIVLRCLAKDPRDRPSSAEEVAEALGHPLAGRPLLHRPAMVGRGDVLAAGARAFDAAKVGQASLLLLVGEPGAGKTRCLSELAEAASRGGFRVIASGNPPRPGAPLDALRPAMEAMLAAPELLPAEDVEILRRYFQPEALPGAAHERWQVESALRRGLAGLSRSRPLLLVLDDLQWADEASVAALAALGEERRSVGWVAIAAACRAHEGSACREWLGAAGWPIHALAGLSRGEVQSLAQELLAGRAVPPELTAVLERQGGGNPFFISEYVRMAVAERVLSRDPTGRWRLEGGAEAARRLPVPGSLRELLQRAMERLSPPACAAAEVASIAGRVVDRALVARLCGLPEGTAPRALQELRDGGVLEEEGGELRFRHDAFREAVAARIPGERRRALHQGCALALESRGAGDDPRIAGAMAKHWEAAGEPLRACDYLEQAGRRALALGACGDAIAALKRALEIGVEAGAGRRARWRLLLGESYQGQTDHHEAAVHLRGALQSWGLRVPRSRLGWALRLVAAVLSQTLPRRWRRARRLDPEARHAATRLAEALFWTQQLLAFGACTVWCVDMAERAGDRAPARQYAQLGLLAGLAGAHRMARRYFHQAATSGEGTGAALLYEGTYRGLQGDLASSGLLLDRALASLRGARHVHDLTMAHLGRAAADFLACRFEASLARLRAVREEDQSGASLVRVWTYSAEASCLMQLGRHGEAVGPLEEGLEVARCSGDRLGQFLLGAQLALMLFLRGDRARVLGLARTSLALSGDSPYSLQAVLGGYRCASLALLWEWERAGRPAPEVAEMARRSVRLLRSGLKRYPVAVSGSLLCAGLLEWHSGNRRKAARLWRQGLRRCIGSSTRMDEALLHVELARPGASPDPAFHERRAGEIAQEIGCAAHLAALRAARGRSG